MPIYQAIQTLKQNAPLTLPQAQAFVSSLDPKLQKQIIAAIYIGRDNLNASTWGEDTLLSVDCIDHIPSSNYAQIIWEKNDALVSYLNSLETCAANTNFNLNNL
ncbi:TPA: hypothetical protein ACPVXQ_004797 [Vibrio parahaemolyticus]|uniref:hypothetical protein n=1 Tax=Vibrio TaxID=662 RepID=UPI00038E30DA|nr:MULTISPECIES: hypothetical protein [Vibrio]EGR1122348.1 hypothetical protein [Vibrio parahaemolyticus]EQM13939.1 hypothetical protein D024_1306 [Vibrio parahaemolyticus 3259]ETJ85725.1 hypothetical protein D041_4283 [Vibrio parahaemolyticus EKP-008]HCH2420945.1 hypothetical protein [Vibrio parahaemolyticus]